LKELESELGPLLNKLEKKLKRQMLQNKRQKRRDFVRDKAFSEISERIILPIMIEYRKFLESKEEIVLLNCGIEVSDQLRQAHNI
jgi:hypothetical protein